MSQLHWQEELIVMAQELSWHEENRGQGRNRRLPEEKLFHQGRGGLFRGQIFGRKKKKRYQLRTFTGMGGGAFYSGAVTYGQSVNAVPYTEPRYRAGCAEVTLNK